MIEPGAWKARAGEAALGYTSKGNDQLAVDMVITEGPSAGSHITWYGYFTDETFDRTVESLRHMGWTGSDLSDLRGLDTNEVRVVIEHEPDLQGEIRARVKWVNSLGGVALKERMDVGAAKAFAQKFKGKVLALQAAGGSPRKPANNGSQPRPAPAGGGEQRPTGGEPAPSDDIPF